VVDLGSGAGLPGIPVAIVRPDVRVTLADSQRRRVAFLELARDEIPVSNAHPVHARVEDLEGPFDAALARAFAPLAAAWTAAVPLLGSGGSLVYFAGASVDVGGQIAGLSPSPASVRTVAAPSLLASAGPLVIMTVQ
jgi:16S rRNA (guanine527-N7)-methyltransferase